MWTMSGGEDDQQLAPGREIPSIKHFNTIVYMTLYLPPSNDCVDYNIDN